MTTEVMIKGVQQDAVSQQGWLYCALIYTHDISRHDAG